MRHEDNSHWGRYHEVDVAGIAKHVIVDLGIATTGLTEFSIWVGQSTNKDKLADVVDDGAMPASINDPHEDIPSAEICWLTHLLHLTNVKWLDHVLSQK